jgi:hypothetical protein
MIQCKNCYEQAQDNFCSHCGQKTTVGRITLGGLLRDVPHAIFHVDRGFFYNMLHLFKQPGNAIAAYLNGRRKVFFHPASYLIVSLILNYVVVKTTDMHFFDEGELAGMDSFKAAAIRDYDALQWWFLEHTYIYILIAIPASSLFLFGIFKLMKSAFNLAETAAVVLFTIAQGVLIQTFIYLCLGWVNSGPFLRAVETCNVFILIFYASLVIYQVLSSVKLQLVRFLFSFVGGFGLAVVWIGSAYLLYLMLT